MEIDREEINQMEKETEKEVKQMEKDAEKGKEQEAPGEKSGTEENTPEQGTSEQSPEESAAQGTKAASEETGEEYGESSEEAPPEGEDPKSWAEKRAAKKQAKLDKKAQAYRDQIEQLEDRVKRQLAEFENFRNRSEKEKHAMFETGAKSVIEKILPVVDNFERGLATVPEDRKEDPFVDGMNRIYKQLLTELENIGVKPIEAVGKEFDPNLHNAVMQVESEEYESGMVAQELQKGYTYRDSVVRHSMVSVVM